MRGHGKICEIVVQACDVGALPCSGVPVQKLAAGYVHAIWVERGATCEMIRWGAISRAGRLAAGPREGFVQHVARLRPERPVEWMYALDPYEFLYPYHNEPACATARFPALEGGPGVAVESALRDSRGWVVWHFQLENLLGLFAEPDFDLQRLRRELNAKRADAWRRLEKWRVDGRTTLRDLVEARICARNITVAPGFAEARLLVAALGES